MFKTGYTGLVDDHHQMVIIKNHNRIEYGSLLVITISKHEENNTQYCYNLVINWIRGLNNMVKDTLLCRIANSDMRSAARTVMALLNLLQDVPADTQCVASAVLFLSLCERFDLHATDVLNYADNMTKKSGGYSKANFEAVRAYMKNELED